MATQPINRPGKILESVSFRDLLDFDESSSVTVEWRQQMQNIEDSQRSAENESASVRIR
jgi:hypothetical protein